MYKAIPNGMALLYFAGCTTLILFGIGNVVVHFVLV